MTAPQKVTKKRLVAYIDPEIYELIENDSRSQNCSISKSTEKMLLLSLKEKSSTESQYPIKFQNIELTVLSILSNLPLEIIEKLSEQITSSPIFQGRDISVHAVPSQTGTECNMPHSQVFISTSKPEEPEPHNSMIGSIYQDQISAQTGTAHKRVQNTLILRKNWSILMRFLTKIKPIKIFPYQSVYPSTKTLHRILLQDRLNKSPLL